MADAKATSHRRLAIIGAGSSGLICLKYALEMLPDWSVECFEQSDRITGAWGYPYDGFVSTSTKYTTQFSCYPQFDASVHPDGGVSRCEFYRDGEFGEYLTRFADHFDLRRHISHGYQVTALRRSSGGAGWDVDFATKEATGTEQRQFDVVIVCTGLVAEPNSLGDHPRVANLKQLCTDEGLSRVVGKTVVVVGGGEMAADFANRFAHPALDNKVFLSLRSGIRVSPRYHPIRGVPSDFLRNRLMLSIHEDLRNGIGRRFVAARIRHQETFEWLFPRFAANNAAGKIDAGTSAKRKWWAQKLNQRAKSDLFDMFHNKSDDFLSAIAEGRLDVVGPPVDTTLTTFHNFDGDGVQAIDPDIVLPALGFRSTLRELTGGTASLSDFYLGCCHVKYDDLFLVGFARPVIGNIPSMSEMQALYVMRLIAGRAPRPRDLARRHGTDAAARRKRFAGVEPDRIYPVEMFPYCDRLAHEMSERVGRRRGDTLRDWWTIQTAPATTLDYACFRELQPDRPKPPTYLPTSLILMLFLLKPIDWLYRLIRRYR